jgi:putative ABC transport system permease protein
MFSNYFKIGFRNLLKNRLFTLINISGMAIGIGSFLIIALFVYDELIFDKHVEDVSLKYRVYAEHFNEEGFQRKVSMIPPPIGPTMEAEYPEVDYYARFMNFNNPVLFEVGEKKLSEAKGGYADPTILKMFSLKLIEGEVDNALKEPNTVAISQSLARKYFGDKPALGEAMKIFNEDFKVSAVFQDFSSHSHFQLNYFIAMAFEQNQIPQRMLSWGWSQFHTYVKLKPGTDAAQLELKLKDFAERNAWPVTKPNNGTYYIPHLMPLEKIHLYASDQNWDIAVRGNAQTVYILSATAIFILLIAILNFINLSTARAVNRVKEVGVRKVVGAYRTQLIYQFISESVIIALIALMIGGLITELVLPALNVFTEKAIPTGIFLNPLMAILLLVFALIIGVAAGAYPAFYISGYNPSQILSAKQSGRTSKNVLRKGLVVFQFILSFLLIIAALIVSDQHTYMRTKDMGFDKDNVLVMQIHGDMWKNLDVAKNTFADHPNVVSASLQYGLPGEAFAGDGIIDKVTNKEHPVSLLIADEDYVKTLGLHVIAGRDFSKEFPSDAQHAFLVSESAAKMLGHIDPKDALEHPLRWNRWDNADSMKEGRVIGVVKDFHLNSLREAITPVVIQVFPFGYSSLSLRVKPENLPETINYLETVWKKFNPKWPFEYRFLDDNFDKLYKSEEKLAKLFTFFTAFTVFVACLGLFGLVVYSTSQRYKEISIRKVLGADESSLVLHLGKNYVLLIIIAFMIAMPFSYYAANQWLEKFTYRIDITPMLFIKAALTITIIALITVGIQSLKAARTNPVNALKEQ